MQGEVEDALPRPLLFAPDEDLAIVARRCQYVSIFRMSPRYAPDGAFVPEASRRVVSQSVLRLMIQSLCSSVVQRECHSTRSSPFQCFGQALSFAIDLEDFDCAIG